MDLWLGTVQRTFVDLNDGVNLHSVGMRVRATPQKSRLARSQI